MAATLTRRSFLSATLATGSASALGRIPFGATLRVRFPWPTTSLDPHDLHDATAALFAGAAFDSLYDFDTTGQPYPTLAEGMPIMDGAGTIVRLRPGLVTAHGQRLDAVQVAWSLARARRFGARPLLQRFEVTRVERKNPLSIRFGRADPVELARALASPLSSIVPRSFSAREPDGTGAFVATIGADSLLLRRNTIAARGTPYLERIEIHSASDLADALRAFESDESDIGWLGAGLHRPRSDAQTFSTPPLGWILLRTGNESAAWGAPGIAQSLANSIPRNQLAHLGFAESGVREHSLWGGPSTTLLVRRDAPHLVEVARVVAAALGTPSHPVAVLPSPAPAIAESRRTGKFSLMLDVARLFGPTKELSLLSLLAAADPAQALKPPDLRRMGALDLTRTLQVGVLGILAVSGAHDPAFRGIAEWRLGNVYRAT